jgi:hypothetical protein
LKVHAAARESNRCCGDLISSFPAASLYCTVTTIMHKENAEALLKQMLGPVAEFRDGQWEAIDYLSDDGQVLLALCSAFALPQGAAGAGIEPLRLSEWNQLAKQIHGSPLKRPAALQGRPAEDLAKQLIVGVTGPSAAFFR